MDPVSALGLVASCASLTKSCVSVCKALSDLAEKYKYAELSILSLAEECSTVQLAWVRIERWVSQNAHRLDDGDDVQERLKKSLHTGRLVISALEEDLANSKKATGTNGFLRRSKIVWNETAMRDHQHRLRGQVGALTLLLEVLQLSSQSDREDLMSVKGTVFIAADESARAIIPSRQSYSSSIRRSIDSYQSGDLYYKPLAFENDLFSSYVYKRNFRIPGWVKSGSSAKLKGKSKQDDEETIHAPQDHPQVAYPDEPDPYPHQNRNSPVPASAVDPKSTTKLEGKPRQDGAEIIIAPVEPNSVTTPMGYDLMNYRWNSHDSHEAVNQRQVDSENFESLSEPPENVPQEKPSQPSYQVKPVQSASAESDSSSVTERKRFTPPCSLDEAQDPPVAAIDPPPETPIAVRRAMNEMVDYGLLTADQLILESAAMTLILQEHRDRWTFSALAGKFVRFRSLTYQTKRHILYENSCIYNVAIPSDLRSIEQLAASDWVLVISYYCSEILGWNPVIDLLNEGSNPILLITAISQATTEKFALFMAYISRWCPDFANQLLYGLSNQVGIACMQKISFEMRQSVLVDLPQVLPGLHSAYQGSPGGEDPRRQPYKASLMDGFSGKVTASKHHEYPRGECGMRLSKREGGLGIRQRCSCQRFSLDQSNMARARCRCGHQAWYHEAEPMSAVSPEEHIAFIEKVKQMKLDLQLPDMSIRFGASLSDLKPRCPDGNNLQADEPALPEFLDLLFNTLKHRLHQIQNSSATEMFNQRVQILIESELVVLRMEDLLREEQEVKIIETCENIGKLAGEIIEATKHVKLPAQRSTVEFTTSSPGAFWRGESSLNNEWEAIERMD